MAAQGKHNNKAYIIDNGLVVREVEVLRITRDLYTIRYIGTDTVIRVHKKRLFSTEDQAIYTLPPSVRPKKKSHWDYYLNH